MNFNQFNSMYSDSARQQILKLISHERYSRNQALIEELTKSVSGPKEYESLMKLLIDVYESGYMLAINQHKEALEKMGLQPFITKQEHQAELSSKENKIFK